MQTAAIAVSLFILIWVTFFVSFQDFDLRKRSSWLYFAICFLCGLALGFAITGNLIEGLKMGSIYAFMILFVGVIMRGEKQKSKRMARTLVRKYEKENPPSLFAKLVIKLFGRHK
jgi:uncharacterized membrane protein YfcA